MNEFEDRLQNRLERLEAGEPLAACLSGLPAEDIELLTLAAALRQTTYPIPTTETAVSQRAALQRLALQTNTRPAAALSELMGRLTEWWQSKTMVQRRELITAVATVAVILFFTALVTLFSPDKSVPVADIGGIKNGGEQTTAQVSSTEPAAVPGTIADTPVAEESGESVYIPLVTFPLDKRPGTAVLDNIHGYVEVQNEAGEWTAVSQPISLAAGQRIRTGTFSQASLGFYDGSQAQIGPNSELSLDAVDAQLPENGFRTIVMTQWLGESEHNVQFRNDSGSLYEVKSPYGTGIAKGTTFQVLVTADLRARYSVSNGRVEVTGAGSTVSVTPGKVSTIQGSEPPTRPDFLVIGEGEVSQIGTEWIIGGQIFQTNDQTIITGSPQIGDWVRVEGHLLPDGTRLADRITLLHSVPVDEFSITGQVEAVNAGDWIVAGQTILVDAATDIETGIVVGDVVRVEGVIQADGSLLAERIHLIEINAGLPFEFTGIVQSINGRTWMISGVSITTDANTEIKGEIGVGDVAKVEGWISPEGVWLAREIKLIEDVESRFEITGEVESIDPWRVAGILFTTNDRTQIEAGIAVGDLVKVEGHILPDGTWVADEIKLLAEEDQLTFEFYGTVARIDPWVVSGIALPVTGETAVDPGIAVGDLVKVTVTILPDGSWRVVSIVLVNSVGDDAGCFSVTAVVLSFSDNQLTVEGWPVFQLGDDVELAGQIQPGIVITLYACVDEEGKLVILDIIILSTPEPPGPVDTPEPPPSDSGARVTICHKPNSKAEHTIVIDQAAVQAHLNHGDTLGPCP